MLRHAYGSCQNNETCCSGQALSGWGHNWVFAVPCPSWRRVNSLAPRSHLQLHHHSLASLVSVSPIRNFNTNPHTAASIFKGIMFGERVATSHIFNSTINNFKWNCGFSLMEKDPSIHSGDSKKRPILERTCLPFLYYYARC